MSAEVIRPPQFMGVSVGKQKVRGRPKNTISLRAERRRRKATPAESPYHPIAADLPPAKKGSFHYPKSLLLQHYFCRGGNGVWHAPQLRAADLVDKNFLSPMKALLEQLKREGHDVSGAELEWAALRDTARALSDLGTQLMCGGPPSKAAAGADWSFSQEPKP